MTISQPNLQQLHARLEAHVTEHDDNGMVTKRDLRDLVACFIDVEAACSCPLSKPSATCRVHGAATDVDVEPEMSEPLKAGILESLGIDTGWPWEVVGTELHYDGTLYATCYTVGGARGLLTALRQRESSLKESARLRSLLAAAEKDAGELARLRAEAKPERAGREQKP